MVYCWKRFEENIMKNGIGKRITILVITIIALLILLLHLYAWSVNYRILSGCATETYGAMQYEMQLTAIQEENKP